MSEDLAARFFRGVRKQDWVIDGPGGTKAVSAAAFEPQRGTETSRKDGRCEASINWDDDAEALPFTLGQVNSQHGIAAVNTSDLLALEQHARTGGVLSHERSSQPENKFHGNLLYVATAPRKFLLLVAGHLAFHSAG